MKPETMIKHEVTGVWFEARADLAGGVSVLSGSLTLERIGNPKRIATASAAFGAWHAMEIRPQLASFAGYDTVKFK